MILEVGKVESPYPHPLALNSLWKDSWIGMGSWFIKEPKASLTFSHDKKEQRLEDGEAGVAVDCVHTSQQGCPFARAG